MDLPYIQSALPMDGMTTSGAWIAMYSSFLEDLSGQFPDDKTIVAALAEAEIATTDDTKAKEILDDFLVVAGPKHAEVTAKDESFVRGLEFRGVDFGTLWDSELMAQQSKDATFQYFSSLLLIAQTLKMIPPELMSGIEAMAKQIAGNMTASGIGGSGGMPDMSSLMSMMGNMGGLSGLASLAGLGGGGGLGGLGDLLNPPAPRRQPRIEDVSSRGAGARTNKHKNPKHKK